MRYAYVQLSRWDFIGFRILGPGLGNLLFPWARAIVASRLYGLTPIWPTWPQIKIGPFLRQERDRRFYADLFRNPGDYIGGPSKTRLIMSAPRIPEYALREILSEESDRRHTLVRFSGMQGLFEPFLGDRDLIRMELQKITRPRHMTGMSHDFRRSITVHIRLEDFVHPDDGLLRSGAFNVRLPFGWIKETISVLRKSLGQDWPVWVFSDGSNDDLNEILTMPDVYRLDFGSALADMLAMSCSTILMPASTFSLWSSFLGGMPTVYYPGQLRQKLRAYRTGYEIERHRGQNLPHVFLDAARTYIPSTGR